MDYRHLTDENLDAAYEHETIAFNVACDGLARSRKVFPHEGGITGWQRSVNRSSTAMLGIELEMNERTL